MAVLKQRLKQKCTCETFLTFFRNSSAAVSSGFSPNREYFMLDTLELPFLFSCLSMSHWSPPFCLYRWSYAQEMETLNVHVYGIRVCVCVCAVLVRACVRALEGGGGGGGGETGYVGNNTKHKKCHMIWSTGLIYLASERICCMWFREENVFLLCSQCAQTQHMETFSERPWVCE